MSNPIGTQTAGQIFQELFGALSAEAVAAAKAPISAMLTSIIADPSPTNVVAQGALVAPQVIAAAPALEDTAIKIIAQAAVKLLALVPNNPPVVS